MFRHILNRRTIWGKAVAGILAVWIVSAVTATDAKGQSSASVSVSSLRNPMPRKAVSFFTKLLSDSPSKPSGELFLRKNLQDPELAPYALKALGMRHLNSYQFAEAERELEQASEMLPWDAQTAGFLSFARYAAGRKQMGLEIAQSVLLKDSRDAGANLVVGLAKLEAGEAPDEATLREISKRFRLATPTFPGAPLALWNFHMRRGETKQAEKEMAAYRAVAERLAPEQLESVEEWIHLRLSKLAHN